MKNCPHRITAGAAGEDKSAWNENRQTLTRPIRGLFNPDEPTGKMLSQYPFAERNIAAPPEYVAGITFKTFSFKE